MTHWHIARYKPSKRELALKSLEDSGYKAVCPMLRESLTRLVPFFPGYLFVQEHDNWWKIGRLPGLREVMCLAGVYSEGNSVPAMIPNSFLDGVWARVAYREALADPAPFKPGDIVSYRADEYGLHKYRVEGMDKEGRIQFFMTLLGKLHLVSEKPEKLVKVG